MAMPFWAALVAAFIICFGIWWSRYLSRPANAPRRQSQLAKGLWRQDCGTCYGEGVYDLTDPKKHLLLEDQMICVNATNCDCCQGNGFHMMPKGARKVCKVYV